jgi:hypothetical protein
MQLLACIEKRYLVREGNSTANDSMDPDDERGACCQRNKATKVFLWEYVPTPTLHISHPYWLLEIEQHQAITRN